MEVNQKFSARQSLRKFTLLKWTGLLCSPAMVMVVFVSFEWQLLLLGLAILELYIIPGHVLHVKEKLQNK